MCNGYNKLCREIVDNEEIEGLKCDKEGTH